MKRVDVVILAALALAVVGSALAVVTYEDSRGSEFRVTWSTRQEALEAEPASLTGPGDAEITLPVLFANVTTGELVVEVASSPGALAPIAVRIEVTIPGVNESIVQEGELPTASPGATFTVPVELATVPEETTVRAATPEAAAAQLARERTSRLGEGNWTVRVSLSPTAPDPLGAVQHTISLRADLQVFVPEIVVRAPEVER